MVVAEASLSNRGTLRLATETSADTEATGYATARWQLASLAAIARAIVEAEAAARVVAVATTIAMAPATVVAVAVMGAAEAATAA